MNRAEGLVQRRTVTGAQANDKSNDSKDETELKSDANNHGNYYADGDVDSKETRLTLMEEVLLLGLKDKEVS